MNRFLTLLFLSFFCVGMMTAQTIFEEDFEGGSLPAGWNMETNSTDGGWLVGSAAGLSSSFFTIESNGSSNIAATNDDACNCDKSDEYLITPAIDLSDQTSVTLSFDAYFLDNTYQGDQEDATIEISTNGTDWVLLEDLHGHGSWDTHSIDISDYAGEETVYIGFRYDDDGGWLYGFAIDNVILEVPPALDAGLAEISSRSFGETGNDIPIKGLIYNAGANTITSLEISYTVDGGSAETETLDNLSIEAFSYEEFELANPWVPSEAGVFDIDVELTAVNGGTDENASNNALSFETEIYEQVDVPNKMEDFLAGVPVLTELTDAAPYLDKPSDLDFFPIAGKDELWIVNQRTENSGGSTLTISDATSGSPSDYWERVDGNAWHFMSIPTGVAFSEENFNFATSPGVQDANHGGGTFTGPTLWSSDPEIYAQPSGGNGSHLDMLHGSPFSMGIAAETENVFWVYDDWNSDIVRYDFVEDHGPGNDDHADGIVHRYQNLGIFADGDVPNHLILDKETGWMYVVDNGNDRVLRLDINSGTGSTTLPLINEPLAEHLAITGFVSEEIISSGLEQPCGIEIFENHLLVGDYATGDIVVYDMDDNFAELGRLPTNNPGLTGIKVGPDGNIWYTNRIENKLYYAIPGEATSLAEIDSRVQILMTPNPTTGPVNIQLKDATPDSELNIQVINTAGQVLRTVKTMGNNFELDFSNLSAGMYYLEIRGEDFHQTEKLMLSK